MTKKKPTQIQKLKEELTNAKFYIKNLQNESDRLKGLHEHCALEAQLWKMAFMRVTEHATKS